MSATDMQVSRRVGQLLLSIPFIRGSVRGMRNADKLAAFAGRANVPFPIFATQGTAAVMLGGAVALGTGLAPRSGAMALVGTLTGVTMTVHPYWRDTDPASRAVHREAFVTNAALIGGLLLVSPSRPRRKCGPNRSSSFAP